MPHLSFRREKRGVFTDAAGHAILLFRCCQSKLLLKHRMSSLALKAVNKWSREQLAPSILPGRRNLSKTDVSPLNIYRVSCSTYKVILSVGTNFGYLQLCCRQLQTTLNVISKPYTSQQRTRKVISQWKASRQRQFLPSLHRSLAFFS